MSEFKNETNFIEQIKKVTCHLCACGTPIYYDSMHDTEKSYEGCDREYIVDKETGKLIEVPPIEEFNLNKRNPFGEK